MAPIVLRCVTHARCRSAARRGRRGLTPSRPVLVAPARPEPRGLATTAPIVLRCVSNARCRTGRASGTTRSYTEPPRPRSPGTSRAEGPCDDDTVRAAMRFERPTSLGRASGTTRAYTEPPRPRSPGSSSSREALRRRHRSSCEASRTTDVARPRVGDGAGLLGSLSGIWRGQERPTGRSSRKGKTCPSAAPLPSHQHS